MISGHALTAALTRLPPHRQRATKFSVETAQRLRAVALASALPQPRQPGPDAAPVTPLRSAGKQSPSQSAPLVVTPSSTDLRPAAMAALRESVLPCEKCAHLAASRTHVVFGVGNPGAELMFVGEAPGADEDAQGEPFVGRAGQLLTRIIAAMNFTREQVYIANVLKCRPDMPQGASGNRPPTPAEMAECLPHLLAQLRVVRPRVVVALGAIAMEGLFGRKFVLNTVRGQWQMLEIPEQHGGAALTVPVMPTYHPAYLLRNQSPAQKRKVWEDMLLVLERLGVSITAKQRAYFQSA